MIQTYYKQGSNYDEYYANEGKRLGHYFRVLYRIFKFIDETDGIDSSFYAKVVRSQISDYEVAILLVNGTSKHGKGFKPLIESYSLLKHAKLRDVEFIESKFREYKMSAYKGGEIEHHLVA